jgi:hypothetical protein
VTSSAACANCVGAVSAVVVAVVVISLFLPVRPANETGHLLEMPTLPSGRGARGC